MSQDFLEKAYWSKQESGICEKKWSENQIKKLKCLKLTQNTYGDRLWWLNNISELSVSMIYIKEYAISFEILLLMEHGDSVQAEAYL